MVLAVALALAAMLLSSAVGVGPASASEADDDIPGVLLRVGGAVLGAVDVTDPADVYALNLNEGEEVHFRCDPGKVGSARGLIHLLVPGVSSVFSSVRYDEVAYNLVAGSPTRHWADFDYIPARAGIYYLWVDWKTDELEYELSVWRTSRAGLESAPDADDIPGTPLAPGIVEGVVSALTDPDDVYAITLAAGKAVTLQLMPLTPYANTVSTFAYLSLLGSHATTIDGNGGDVLAGPVQARNAAQVFSRQTAEIRYIPAKSDTYFVRVTAESVPYRNNFAYRLRVVTDGGSTGLPEFADIADSPYASAIYELATEGIVSGYGDRTFRPGDPVSRQQFAKMIVRTLSLAITGAEICPFPDVATGLDPGDSFYPDKYVAVCAAQGIARGYDDGSFGPYDQIRRQQLISMVARAADLADPDPGYAPDFERGQFYPEEHYSNASRAAYAGLLDGLPGVDSFYDFYTASTRGECAQILYNLLQRQ
jgi:S-layer homology domain